MKRFLLFAGSIYYPAGGWDDFRGDFDTAEKAQSAGQVSFGDEYEWWHVVDTETMKEVAFAAVNGDVVSP